MKTGRVGYSGSFKMLRKKNREPNIVNDVMSLGIFTYISQWRKLEKLKSEALGNYREKRENGTSIDNPEWEFPGDGRYKEIHEGGDAGYSWVNVHIEYAEGMRDREWMKKKDENYLRRCKLEEEEQKDFSLKKEEEETKELKQFKLEESKPFKDCHSKW